MNKLEYFLKVEERMKRESETETLIELNFFTYNYELGISRVSYNGEEYLCFPFVGPSFFSPPYTEQEKELLGGDEVHVYLLGEDAVLVEDEQLKTKILELHHVQRKKRCGE